VDILRGVGALALWGLVAAGCGSGGVSVATAELRYDSDNLSAPILSAATYQAAARFDAAQTAPLAGGELTEVWFWIEQLPASCRVRLYGAGGAGSPGAELYATDVTAGLVPAAWNSHALPAPLVVPDTDVWIAIEFTQAVEQQVIGCDSGPLVADGDWLYSSLDGSWIPLSQRQGASVNWNIRGIVALP